MALLRSSFSVLVKLSPGFAQLYFRKRHLSQVFPGSASLWLLLCFSCGDFLGLLTTLQPGHVVIAWLEQGTQATDLADLCWDPRGYLSAPSRTECQGKPPPKLNTCKQLRLRYPKRATWLEQCSDYLNSLQIEKYKKGMKVLVAQSCLTLFTDCNLPGSSVHGDFPGKNTGVGCHALLQRIFQPRDQTQVSCIAGRFFTSWATREAQEYWNGLAYPFSMNHNPPEFQLSTEFFRQEYWSG